MRDWSEAQKHLSNSVLLQVPSFRDPCACIVAGLYYFSDFKFGVRFVLQGKT